MNEDIIETLQSIQCSDAACGNLRIAMGMKLAIYEIERLRADLMCLKNQNAEFVRALTTAQDERNAAVKERDEARRDVCNMMHMSGFLAGDYADSKGWDCFKDGHTGFSTDIENFREIFYGCKDKLRAERDEARREVCELKSYNFESKITPKTYAELRKWDCFNMDSNQTNTGMEYEDVLMRNQEYAAEIKRLTDELAATKDRLAENQDDIRHLLKFNRDMMTERDMARKELMMWLGERCSNKELKQEYKNRGWEYLKEM